MDIAVLVILLVMYLVWQALTSVGTQQKPPPSPRQQPGAQRGPRTEGDQANSELQEALREIREAMGGPAEPRPQRRTSQQQNPQRRASSPPPAADGYRARQEELRREQQKIEEETRRFEERREATMHPQLERQRTLAERAAAADRRTAETKRITEQPLSVETDVATKDPAHASRWAQRLYRSEAAREAIVLSEVIGPPRARTWLRRYRP